MTISPQILVSKCISSEFGPFMKDKYRSEKTKKKSYVVHKTQVIFKEIYS